MIFDVGLNKKNFKQLRNINYLLDLESKNSRKSKIEYLARMRKFTILDNNSTFLDLIKAFSKSERLVGIK